MIEPALKQVMTDKEIEIYLELVIKDLHEDFKKDIERYDQNLTQNHSYLEEHHQAEMMFRNFQFKVRELEEEISALKLTLLARRKQND